MGLINAITKIEELEAEGVIWAREILRNSPTAIRILKASFNAENDGIAVFKNYLDTQLNYSIRLKKLKKVEMPFLKSVHQTFLTISGHPSLFFKRTFK